MRARIAVFALWATICLFAWVPAVGAIDLVQAGQPAPGRGILLDVPTSFRVLEVLEDYPRLKEENAALQVVVAKQESLDEIRVEREKLYQDRIAFLELQAEKWKQLNDASLALARQNREMQGSWWDRFLGDMGKLATGAIVGGVIIMAIAL